MVIFGYLDRDMVWFSYHQNIPYDTWVNHICWGHDFMYLIPRTTRHREFSKKNNQRWFGFGFTVQPGIEPKFMMQNPEKKSWFAGQHISGSLLVFSWVPSAMFLFSSFLIEFLTNSNDALLRPSLRDSSRVPMAFMKDLLSTNAQAIAAVWPWGTLNSNGLLSISISPYFNGNLEAIAMYRAHFLKPKRCLSLSTTWEPRVFVHPRIRPFACTLLGSAGNSQGKHQRYQWYGIIKGYGALKWVAVKDVCTCGRTK